MINGYGFLASSSLGTILLSGGITGDTRNADLHRPMGTVGLDGVTNLLEVMSQDLGATGQGFQNNFAYGTLALAEGTTAQLVDQSDNATGIGAEAVYVNALVVPANATLELNGFHVYARSSQILGTVVGGTVMQVPDGGQVLFSTPTAGHIGAAAEQDEWWFFGRSGQSVAVVTNPRASLPAPLTPYLSYAEVKLLDAGDNVLATGSSLGAGAVVTLNNIALPADGVYRIQISAPTTQPQSTGNYLVTLWNATPDVMSLNLNEQSTGQIETPFSEDRWNFSAVAGQQIQFDLVNTTAFSAAFTLSGPDGYVAFTDLTSDSGLITLPASGSYLLRVRGSGGQMGTYTFCLRETPQVDLALGVPYAGDFAGSAGAVVPHHAAVQYTSTDRAGRRGECGSNGALPVHWRFADAGGLRLSLRNRCRPGSACLDGSTWYLVCIGVWRLRSSARHV